MAANDAHRPPAGDRGWRYKADVWTGLGAIALGLAMLYIGADYGLGRPGRIGPGYVPRLLAFLLGGLGLVLLVRAARAHDLVDADIAWRPLLLVIGAILTFALLLDRAGLIVAIVATVIVAAPAAVGNTMLSVLISGVILAVFSWGLFVKALKISIPVWWF
jgi:hypothetical protein